MNCLELRRQAMADPRRMDAAAADHAARCAPCRDFLGRALELESRLEAELRFPVSPELKARMLERLALRRPAMRRYALAAGFLLAVAAAFSVALLRDDPLALAGIDFVVFEEAQAIADAAPVDPSILARVARQMGVALPEQLGEISYVCFYPFAGGAAHHLLVKTPLGKVTLLLIPERRLAARAAAAARGLEAAIVPAAAGSIVIIGESARSIGRVEALLKST